MHGESYRFTAVRTQLFQSFRNIYSFVIVSISCLIYHNGAFWLRNIPDNCSMTTLGQRWLTVVPLADSWRRAHNVGPTLGKHQ